MPLTARQIVEEVQHGNILIKPFLEKRVGANSYDVSLARNLLRVTSSVLDLKKPYATELIEIPDEGYVLEPGEFYLGVTDEWTYTHKFVPILEGRSTAARYNLVIHQTAGFGDIGFGGHWTLEITVTKPTRIYPHVRIGQIYFEPITDTSPNYTYQGKYKNEYSNNPLPASGSPGNF